jgi:hypothetical protein
MAAEGFTIRRCACDARGMGSLLLVALALGVVFALGFFMGQTAGLRRGLREALLVPPGPAGSPQPPAAPVVWRPKQADRTSRPYCA